MTVPRTMEEYNQYMADHQAKLHPVPVDTEEADEGRESRLQSKIEDHCKAHGYPCLSIPQWATRHRVVRRFLPEGWPDMTVVVKGRVVLMELKAKGGKLRSGQEQFKRTLMFLGFPVDTVKSFRKARELMDDH